MNALPTAGFRFDGHTAAVEDGRAWAVRYEIAVDEAWATRSARIWGRSLSGSYERSIEGDGRGHWRVDGEPRPDLDGCFDVDLESSACTNTFPVHRMSLEVGERAEAPAVYVRAVDLKVQRLEQHYIRVPSAGPGESYDYRGDEFGYHDRLEYDGSGLVVDYPALAVRVL